MRRRISLQGASIILAATFVTTGSLLVIDGRGATPNLNYSHSDALLGVPSLLIGLFFVLLWFSGRKNGWLAMRIRERYYSTKWWFRRFPIEYRILLYGGFALIVLIIARMATPSHFVSNLESPKSVIQTNAQILATIFAITISLTLLGLEYYSQRLTPRLAKSVLQSTFIKLLLVSYTMSIIADVAVASFFPDSVNSFLLYSFLALAWCLIYLVAYLYNLIRRLQPGNQMDMIERSIPKDFSQEIVQKHRRGRIQGTDERDRFIDIQKIIIRTVRENDIYLFGEWVRLLFGKEHSYLKEIRSREQEGDQTLSGDEAQAISSYFLHLQQQIYQEILNTNNIGFLNSYIGNISNVVLQLVGMRQGGWLNGATSHFDEIGMKIVSNEYDSLFQAYGNALQTIAEAEIASIPREEKHLVWNDAYRNMNDLSEEEYKERAWYRSSRDAFRHRLSFLEGFAEEAIGRGYDEPVRLSLQICTKFLQEAVEEESKPFRNFFANNSLQSQKRIHDNAVRNGIAVSFFWPIGLGDILETMDPDKAEEIGVGLTELYCDSAVLAVENDVWNGYHDLGVLGRTVIERSPKIVLEVIDALEECLEILLEEGGHEEVTPEMIAEQIASLYRWNDHEDVKERIERIYDDYNVDVVEE